MISIVGPNTKDRRNIKGVPLFAWGIGGQSKRPVIERIQRGFATEKKKAPAVEKRCQNAESEAYTEA